MVLKDIFSRYWPTYLIIGLFAMLMPWLQTAGLVLFIHVFKGDNHFVLPYNLQRYLPHVPSNEFIILGLASLFMLASLALMIYSRKLAINLMIRYESECSKQIIKKLIKKDKRLEGKSDSQIMIVLSKDCRQGGRIALEIGNLVMPLGVLIVVLPVMFYISTLTTFALIALLTLTTVIYSRLARVSHSISNSIEKSGIEDAQMKKELIKRIKEGEFKGGDIALPHPNFARSYQERIMLPQWGLVVGGIQLILSLMLIVLLIMPNTNTGANSLSLVVLYGSLAIFALTQLRGVSKMFANFHVFLAYFQRAFVIIKDIDPNEYNLKLFEAVPNANTSIDELEF